MRSVTNLPGAFEDMLKTWPSNVLQLGCPCKCSPPRQVSGFIPDDFDNIRTPVDDVSRSARDRSESKAGFFDKLSSRLDRI